MKKIELIRSIQPANIFVSSSRAVTGIPVPIDSQFGLTSCTMHKYFRSQTMFTATGDLTILVLSWRTSRSKDMITSQHIFQLLGSHIQSFETQHRAPRMCKQRWAFALRVVNRFANLSDERET